MLVAGGSMNRLSRVVGEDLGDWRMDFICVWLLRVEGSILSVNFTMTVQLGG